MPYAQLDDGFYDHPTFANIADDLVGIWAKGLAYCNRHMTDGLIPKAKALSFCVTADRETLIERMVSAKLWRERGNDVEHIGYLDHNPSRADIRAKVKASKDRKEKWKAGLSGTLRGTRSGTRSSRVPERGENASGTVSLPTLPPSLNDPPTPLGVRETACKAFGEGIRTVMPGPPFTVLDDEASVLMRVVGDHPRWASLRGSALAQEIRASAAKYARERAGDAKFEQGFSPTKWAQWRRAGGDTGSQPASGEHATARKAASAQEDHERELEERRRSPNAE